MVTVTSKIHKTAASNTPMPINKDLGKLAVMGTMPTMCPMLMATK